MVGMGKTPRWRLKSVCQLSKGMVFLHGFLRYLEGKIDCLFFFLILSVQVDGPGAKSMRCELALRCWHRESH